MAKTKAAKTRQRAPRLRCLQPYEGRAPAKGGQTPQPPHPSRMERCWVLARCCAELALLAGLVAATHVLTPLARWAFPHYPQGYAALVAGLAAGGYFVLTAFLARFHRKRGGHRADEDPAAELPEPSGRTLAVALRRAGPALLALAVVLVPYALAGNRSWLVLTFVLAAVLCLLEGLWYRRQCRRPPGGDDSAQSPSGPRAEKIDALRDFARRQGLEDPRIVLAARRDEPAAAGYLPTRPQPTFLVTGRLLDMLRPAELRAAFAHEVAHHQMGHSGKAVLARLARKLAAVMAVAAVLAAAKPAYPPQWELTRLAPILLLVWYVVWLLLAPAELAYHRHQEAQAFRRALEMTGDGEALVSALQKIAACNGATCPPAWWEKWLLVGDLSLSEAVCIARRHVDGPAPGAPPAEMP